MSIFKKISRHNKNFREVSTRLLSTTSVDCSSTKNILRSTCPDVVIEPKPLSNFIWDESVRQWPNRIALVDGVTEKSFSYASAYEESRAFGSSLTKVGMNKSDVLAILMPNCPQYLIGLLGAIGIGCVVTTINPSYTAFEVARQLTMSKAKMIMVQPQSLAVVEEAVSIARSSIKIIIMDENVSTPSVSHLSYKKMTQDTGSQYPETVPDFNFHEDVATLPYSSGTTGLPKGVMLTHANNVSNMTQMYYAKGLDFLPPTTEDYQPTTVCVLPMFHIFGLSVVSLTTLHCGGKIITLPGFDPKTFVNALEKNKPDTLHFAPPLVTFCAHSPDVKADHLANLLHIKVGAAPVGETLINLFHKKAPHVLFREGWGMTELSPIATMTGKKEIVKGSCGVLAPNTEAKIVHLETGEALGPGETGELCIRGPQVMKGYLDNPEATKTTIMEDGWLHSGDIAYYDEGHHFFIVDRLKELVKVKGYQVPPAELEDLIRSIPAVEDIGVIGIPDSASGELPRAYVVKKKGSNLTAEDIHKFVNNRVAKYKRLEGGIEFVESIPKSAAGKILRKDLKSMYEAKHKQK